MSPKDANKILDAPMVQWSELIAGLTDDGRRYVEAHAASIAARAARLSAYASSVMAGERHSTAVKRQNSVAAKVRRALGYAYPVEPITF